MTAIVPLTNVAATDSEQSGGAAPGLAVPDSICGGVISIGNFDGVHHGHAALMGQVRRWADQLGGPAVAVVLDPHPASILRPDQAPKRLTWIERRAELMDALQMDALVVCETTPEFLRMTAAEFFQSLVVDRLRAQAIVEGPNFFFGRDRGGDVHVLQQLCQGQGIELQVVQPISSDEQLISSTRIRRLLESGDVEQANQLLSAPYRMRGVVQTGAKRGRQIGFPTANLSQIDVVIPAPGVYGGMAQILPSPPTGQTSGENQQFFAAIHIGPNPTFESDGEVKVETHLLDYDGDLYDRTLLVDFSFRVRDVARFDSAERLVEQLNQDIATIRQRLQRSAD